MSKKDDWQKMEADRQRRAADRETYSSNQNRAKHRDAPRSNEPRDSKKQTSRTHDTNKPKGPR